MFIAQHPVFDSDQCPIQNSCYWRSPIWQNKGKGCAPKCTCTWLFCCVGRRWESVPEFVNVLDHDHCVHLCVCKRTFATLDTFLEAWHPIQGSESLQSYECLPLFFRVEAEFNDVASSAKTFINCFPLQVNETWQGSCPYFAVEKIGTEG